ncbi:hypothetical protein CASFOL_023287 [Castilleja foliolosa]|uniref:Uncharacterized protein n=1 Tax=Castilleja foliolosa TaxID=1961234 RepID=A0ABD3CKZ8_9LAMI
MDFVRCFMFVFVSILLNFSYNVKARPLSKSSILLGENDSTKVDHGYLGDEKFLPPEVLCSLLGGCENSMEKSKFMNHIATDELSGEKELIAVEPNYLGDEKFLRVRSFCSKPGSCEQSIKTSKSTNQLMTDKSNGIKDSTMVSDNRIGDEKLPPKVICGLLGGC